MSLSVLPFANQARADDIRDLDSLEALASKWEEVKKEGLSAGDVKKLTDKLKELGGEDIKDTGVGQLLDGMNANAERLAKIKDAGDKLEKTIALEKFGEAIRDNRQPAANVATGAKASVMVQMAIDAMDRQEVIPWSPDYDFSPNAG